jgi:hypothetical protein
VRIPNSFQLLGQRYTVRLLSKDEWKDGDAVGLFYSQPKEIHVLDTNAQLIEHSYLHELTHAILLAMGKRKLYEDEAFVDLFSGMLQQAFNTAEYED